MRKILYVEDNLSNLTLVQRILARHHDIELIPAMQGGLALELARLHHPDLVLLDLHLPDIPGEEVFAQLRRDADCRDIPVVVLSADATREADRPSGRRRRSRLHHQTARRPTLHGHRQRAPRPEACRMMISDELLSRGRILVVDDEQANVRLLERLLLSGGFTEVRGVTDPRNAMALYDEMQPDLVMLDLHMPHLDGYAVLELLRAKLAPNEYLPILVLTADTTREAKERALSNGARDFLTKPLERTEVLLRTRNLLETRYLHLALKDENRSLEAKLVHQAFHDSLTGLANRALFRDRAQHALARSQRGERVAILLLDLDDFKSVNDTLGHGEGDQLLVTVGERLLKATRGCDTVARIGGDEFAVLLEGMQHDDDAHFVATRITDALRAPVRLTQPRRGHQRQHRHRARARRGAYRRARSKRRRRDVPGEG